MKQFVKFTYLSNTSSEEGIMPNINKAAKKYLTVFRTEAFSQIYTNEPGRGTDMTSHESSSAVRDAGHLAVSEEDLSPENKSLSHRKVSTRSM